VKFGTIRFKNYNIKIITKKRIKTRLKRRKSHISAALNRAIPDIYMETDKRRNYHEG